MITQEQKVQGSTEWLELRKKCITASQVAKLFNACPYQTLYEFWKEKVGLVEPVEQSTSMAMGSEKEFELRKDAEETVGYPLPPDVILHPDYDWILASLDGINYDQKVIFEAKLCKKEYYEMVMKGKVPEHWNYQIQTQLACSGFKKCWLSAYSPSYDESLMMVVNRNDELINTIIERCIEFKKTLSTLEAPEMCDRDYYNIESISGAEDIVSKWRVAKMKLAHAIEEEEFYKKQILEFADGRKSRGFGIRIEKIERIGNVDYKKLIDDHQIPNDVVESYRKGGTSYLTIKAD